MKVKNIPWQDLDGPRKLLVQRLLLYTDENPHTECWIWVGAVNGDGMPHATVVTQRGYKQFTLNRLAWHIFHNLELHGSKHIQVRRNTEICDDKLCWNPEHLEYTDTSED